MLSALFSKYVLQAGVVSIAFLLDVVITLLVVSWLVMLDVIIVIDIERINRLATKLACRWFKLIFVTFLRLSEQCTQVRVLSSLLAAVLMGFCPPLRLRLMHIVLTILIFMMLTETLAHDRMQKQRLVHELWRWKLLHIGRVMDEHCSIAINEGFQDTIVLCVIIRFLGIE